MKTQLARFVRRTPSLYRAYCMARRTDTSILVSKTTDIVLEGFGGSGNTFALRAFTFPQIYPYQVAHHVHTSSQIRKGVSSRIPVVVVIRDPADAATSLISRRTRALSDAEIMSMAHDLLERYTAYHEDVLGLSDAIVIAKFETVVSDFGAVMLEVNRKFGTSFEVFEHTKQNVDYIRARQVRAKPGTERANKKEHVQSLLSHSDLSLEMERAVSTFSAVSKVADC